MYRGLALTTGTVEPMHAHQRRICTQKEALAQLRQCMRTSAAIFTFIHFIELALQMTMSKCSYTDSRNLCRCGLQVAHTAQLCTYETP